MVEINDLDALTSVLNKLQDDTPAVWGKMSAQNMIEHISSIVLFSNGRKSIPLLFPEEKAASLKVWMLLKLPCLKNLKIIPITITKTMTQ